MKKLKTSSLLFEIGVEEIPSGYFAGAEASIRTKAPELLADCGWQFDKLEIHTTPRRIVLCAENFRFLKVKEEEKLGPLKDQAYQNNQPTQALIGFLKSTGRSESDVFFKDSPRGARVCVKVKKKYQPLRYFFETLPLKIEFPKLMRWEKGRFTFTRPIRWTFAFVGNKEQKYKIADIKSSHFTYGRRFLSPKPIKVTNSNFAAFEKLLSKYHVILKTEERIKKIRGFLKGFHQSNEELIATVAHLVEDPYPVPGVFDKKYLKLPSAVLATCMSKNQKVFAGYDASGRLQNRFLAVINGRRKDTKTIAKHYESVLISRLEDAQFFYHEDTKTKLDSKLPKLKEMVFLGKLGSYFDKTKRLGMEVKFLGQAGAFDPNTVANAVTAADLAKADLTTHLVYEFPELQGLVGSVYAKEDGQSDQIAEAILGQYLPKSLSEDYNKLKKILTREGALVGLADRMDLLVGALGLGVELDSSQDPYGLRRAAGSIAKILRAHPFSVSLSSWIDFTVKTYGTNFSTWQGAHKQKLISFIKNRIVFELQLKAGTKEYDLLQGIFAAGFDDIANVYEKFNQLSKEINNPYFIRACKVAERTGNILKGVKDDVKEIKPELFSEALEKDLFRIIEEQESAIWNLVTQGNYGASAKAFGEQFYEPVHQFFDQIMVNVPDEKVRMNRQALVKRINRILSDQVADLSQIKAS